MLILTKSKLIEILDRYKIDISNWGKGESKTIDHLFTEIIKGESNIVEKNGSLLRRVSALSIIVRYKDLILREDYQEFNDGRKRKRKMKASVAEKLDPSDKNLTEAVKRAISEELGIEISDNQISKREDEIKNRLSTSYPNLQSEVVLFGFEVNLTDSQFKKDGYVEIQKDKKTFFKWENI
jgi:hypothetical protein